MSLKPVSSITALIVILSIHVSVSPSPEMHQWKHVFTRKISQPLTYAGFTTLHDGITIGVHGLVFYSTDAGKSWQESLNLSACRHGLDILDNKYAWHCGNRSVRRSVDYGKTWTEAGDFGAAEPDHASYISFADAQSGIIATNVTLAVTDNGGLTWNSVQPPSTTEEIAAVSASYGIIPEEDKSKRHGGEGRKKIIHFRVMNSHGIISMSSARCASWKEVSSPAAYSSLILTADAPSAAMRFNSSGDGLIAVFRTIHGKNQPYVCRTSDCGATWHEENFPVDNPGTLFISPDMTIITYIPEKKRSLSVYRYIQ